MAEVEKKKGFPRIARTVWFSLREKLKQRVPSELSPSYLGTSLGMESASASANVIPALKAFGLIDESGKPTERAYDWRDDGKYSAVCQEILEEIYPQELRDLFHGPEIDFESLKGWFSRKAKVGDAAATKFAITYNMLLEADLEKAKSAPGTRVRTSNGTKAAKADKPAVKKVAKAPAAVTNPTPDGHAGGDGQKRSFSPNLHVDIQIHISPDSTPEQIEKIFESMAKHLPIKG